MNSRPAAPAVASFPSPGGGRIEDRISLRRLKQSRTDRLFGLIPLAGAVCFFVVFARESLDESLTDHTAWFFSTGLVIAQIGSMIHPWMKNAPQGAGRWLRFALMLAATAAAGWFFGGWLAFEQVHRAAVDPGMSLVFGLTCLWIGLRMVCGMEIYPRFPERGRQAN